MKKFINYLSLSFLSLLFVNCSASLFSLTPDEESSLEMGRRVITKENDFAYSTLSFEEQAEDHFILYTFIYNKEQKDFVFDPADIYVKYFDEEKRVIKDYKGFALDPEEQIYQFDKSIEERENEHEVNTGLNIAFSLFDTIVDLTDDEDNDAEEVLENVLIFGGNQINEEIDYENDLEYLKSYRTYWKNEALRKTNLSEDKGVDGIIYLPINENAKYIKVYLPIGKTMHSYKFQQIERS
jgi:hypothetical protein